MEVEDVLSTKITLSWPHVTTNTISYIVEYRMEAVEEEWTQCTISDGFNTLKFGTKFTYTLTNLRPNTTYRARMTVVTPQGKTKPTYPPLKVCREGKGREI